MKVSIIVTYTNNYELMENFLEHIVKITKKYEYELILVQDCIASMKLLNLINKFVEESNTIFHFITDIDHRGYSKVNNFGVEKSSGDTLVFINTDVFPDSEAIHILCKELWSNTSYGIVQGLLIYPHNNTVQSTGHVFGNYFNNHALVNAEINEPIVQQKAIRQGVTSAFYAIRKQHFDLVKGFDTYYYNAWDGLDLSLKVTYDLGLYCMYIPESQAYHIQGSSRDVIYRNTDYQNAYFWTKWHNKIQIDYAKLILIQLKSSDLKPNQSYTIINCSTYPLDSWDPILSNLKLQYKATFTIKRYSKKEQIKLEESFSKILLERASPIIYLTDHFKELENNYRTFKLVANKDDFIIDLHGNIKFITKFLDLT